MISMENLQEFASKNQTTLENVTREYIQHLFLSSLYKIKGSEKLLFKGGTSLRIVYGSPRFSEDLDFDGQNIYQPKTIDDLFIKTISEIEKIGVEIGFKEAKKTSGGYLGIISYRLNDVSGEMKFEISLRSEKKADYEATTIVSDYLPPYSIIHATAKKIISGKIAALLDRGKPRDFYDIYFILRHRGLHEVINKNQLEKIEQSLNKTEINFKKELSILLPVSHQIILRDFKKALVREIKRYS